MEIAKLVMELEGYRLTAYEEGGEHFFGCRLRTLTTAELEALVRRHCAEMHRTLRTAIPSFDEMEEGTQQALMLLLHYMGERPFFRQLCTAQSVEEMLRNPTALPIPLHYQTAIQEILGRLP